MDENKRKSKIGLISIVLLVGIASIADLFTFIPAVGMALGPIYWVGLNIYLFIIGFGIINTRRLVTAGASTVAEIIPVIQALPTILFGTVLLIFFLKAEEKTGIKIPAPGNASARATPRRATPLNSDGIRPPRKPARITANM